MKPTNYSMKSFMRNLRRCEKMPVYPAHAYAYAIACALEAKGYVAINRDNPHCTIVTLRKNA
jgi:hypothetical protein